VAVLSSSTIVSQHPEHVACEADGELVIMHLTTGEFAALNSTARAVWTRVEIPASIGEVCDDLMQRYDVDATRCRRSVEDFVERFVAHDFLQVRPDDPNHPQPRIPTRSETEAES
jgi:hypothetical protein